MSGNKGKEDGIVENAKTCMIISQMVVCWLIVIVEDELSSSGHNSFGWTCYSKAIDLVQWTVESLDRGKSSHVPNPKHA